MKLTIVHGRVDPAPDMEAWGFPGPVLEGIKKLHWTYMRTQVEFESNEAREAARQLTGWGDGVYENSLIMLEDEDMIKTWNEAAQRNEWFGDWWLEE